MMVRGLCLEGALEVGVQPAVGTLQLVGCGLQAVDPCNRALFFYLERGDLRVAGRDGRVRRGELSGDAVTVGGGRRPAASDIGEPGGEILSLSIQRLVGGLQGGIRGDDVLQLFDPSGMLVGNVALLGNLALQHRGTAPAPADLVFGLLE